MQKKYLRGSVKGVNPDQKTVRVIASTGAVDREGESLDPTAWDFTNFLANPQLLWSHDAFSPPIGRVTRVWVENGAVMADTEFAEAESEFAALIGRLVRGGFINAVSVGFLPKSIDPSTGHVTGQELLELSYVNIPANQEALVMQRGGEGADMLKALRAMETKMFTGDKGTPKEKTKAMSDAGPAVDAMAAQVAAMQTIMPKLKDAVANEDAAAVDNLMSEIQDHMGQMADAMESMGGMMGDKALKTIRDLREKVGRVISEKNRNQIRLMVDACKQAADAGSKLLDDTTPPDKKGDAPKRKSDDPAMLQHQRELRDLRIVDRAVEILIQGKKEALSQSQNGGDNT